MENSLKQLHESGVLNHLDYYFATILCRTFQETNSDVVLSAALTSAASQAGHVFLDLLSASGQPLEAVLGTEKETGCVLPEKTQWLKSLKASRLIGPTTKYPLVLEADARLYLSRYYNFQERLVANLIKRMQINMEAIEPYLCQTLLDNAFPGAETHNGVACQKKAAHHALFNRLTVISGGPGTGKTYTVEKIIQLLKNPAFRKEIQPVPRIVCAAPTGKAASKLPGGITIHRLLGAGGRDNRFRHHQDNPVPFDTVIIDEASMIDIALMTRLLESIPLGARLILLGDRHQLASVDAGAVFGDICRSKRLAPCLIHLDFNFRSGEQSAIVRLAAAIKKGDAETVENILTDPEHPETSFCGMNEDETLESSLSKSIRSGYEPLLEALSPESAMAHLDRFRLLCAFRKGPFGTLALNKICEKLLRFHCGFDIKEKFFKQVLMIGVNDYSKKLFNGDTGILMDIGKQGLRAVFRNEEGELVWFNPPDLPINEPAFASTVHKSQGSEFDQVLLVLPDTISPLLTRELLYTGITRAKSNVTVAGSMAVIKKAVTRPVERKSAIMEKIDQNKDIYGNDG